MAKKKGNRTWVWMVAETKGETTHRFQTERNKVNEEGKLVIRKFDPVTRTHVTFKETNK